MIQWRWGLIVIAMKIEVNSMYVRCDFNGHSMRIRSEFNAASMRVPIDDSICAVSAAASMPVPAIAAA